MKSSYADGIVFPFVKLLLGIIGLLATKEIAAQISLLQELTVSWLILSPLEWIALAIHTAILVLLLLTMRDTIVRLSKTYPLIPAMGRLVQLLVLFIVLGWAYVIYLPLAALMLGQALYLYQALFAIAVAGTGIGFVITFLKSLNQLSIVFLDWLRNLMQVENQQDM